MCVRKVKDSPLSFVLEGPYLIKSIEFVTGGTMSSVKTLQNTLTSTLI